MAPQHPRLLVTNNDAQAAGLLMYQQINSSSDSAAYQEMCLSPNPFSVWSVYCKITKAFSTRQAEIKIK